MVNYKKIEQVFSRESKEACGMQRRIIKIDVPEIPNEKWIILSNIKAVL